MLKKFIFFTISFIITIACGAGYPAPAQSAASDYMNANTYNNMYPYMNNTMRTQLNPGTTPSTSNAQINALTRTISTDTTSSRRVVPRRATTTTTTTARSATAPTTTTARAGTTAGTATRTVSPRNTNTSMNSVARAATTSQGNTARRVVARSGTSTSNTMVSAPRTVRGDSTVSSVRQNSVMYTDEEEPISSSRCMADYAECMDNYCERADTDYNRCYCSTQLAQIDAKHKPEINRLINEIITLKGTNYWTQEEMDEYWMDRVGQYSGSNSWADLEDALNIDWASTESTIRGQQAFAMGHQYCSQHLQGCAYMQTNMRDAYRSEIARDCAAYETSLQTLKNVAESVIEIYKE